MAETATNDDLQLVHALASAWAAVERRTSGRLGALHGISLGEFRLLHALAEAPQGRASRVELARAVGLTASAVTRALRPLERLGIVTSVKNDRDARLALATLTPAGAELVANAALVVGELVTDLLAGTPLVMADRAGLIAMLVELGRQ
ncbi:MAG: MarR family transcriptional regulator [Acidimicrobiales bacterium]|nr:MarR family transcriptional regulator [Acidimicrobiales bacterium]